MKPSLLMIGLGNPGQSYERTRHNLGFQAIDSLSEAFGEGKWQDKQKFQSLVQEGRLVTFPILLVKPQTYMNRSGEAVRKLVDFYKVKPSEQLLIVCDDVDLPLGEVRFRRKGSPGTHNGLKSIVEQIGEGFPRVRIGLGPQPQGDLATWVLSVPPEEERTRLASVLESLPERVRQFILERKEAA
jgi:PTH1 family peptidyl-tRNA hydrolase